MTYLRLISSHEEGLGQGLYPTPPRRRPPALSLSIAILVGMSGALVMLSEVRDAPPTAPPVRPLERFDPDPPATSPPRLRIVVAPSTVVATHPETWAALPTALTAPVVATPLADPRAATEQAAICREAPGMATQMVCVDPLLAVADRQAADAYEAVLAAGVSPAALGRSQARWMLVREEAARSSPEDLLAAYQDRIGRLRATAAALVLRNEPFTGPPPVKEPSAGRPASPLKAATTQRSAAPAKETIARRPTNPGKAATTQRSASPAKATIARRAANPVKETLARRPVSPGKAAIARRPADRKTAMRGPPSPRSPTATPLSRKQGAGGYPRALTGAAPST